VSAARASDDASADGLRGAQVVAGCRILAAT